MTLLQEIQELINKGIEEDNDFKENEIFDGYHTFGQLYEFRKLYNANLFNEWAKQGLFDVHKSRKHNDGEECFGGGWFIVVALLPTGQISNHYKDEDWDLFQCVDVPTAKYEFDGHTGADVVDRLKSQAKDTYFRNEEQIGSKILNVLLQNTSVKLVGSQQHHTFNEVQLSSLLKSLSLLYLNDK